MARDFVAIEIPVLWMLEYQIAPQYLDQSVLLNEVGKYYLRCFPSDLEFKIHGYCTYLDR